MRPLRPWIGPALLCALFIAGSAFAGEPKCPLDLTTCLQHYQRMQERPWLGVAIERDSSDHLVIQRVEPRSPSQRAGVHEGDLLQSIEGQPPSDWFAGKAGWKAGQTGALEVIRQGRPVKLKLRMEAIPEDVFARIVGIHMVEAHLAYLDHDAKESASEDH
jgi:predicted metalloprotease with PDZ domain